MAFIDPKLSIRVPTVNAGHILFYFLVEKKQYGCENQNLNFEKKC